MKPKHWTLLELYNKANSDEEYAELGRRIANMTEEQIKDELGISSSLQDYDDGYDVGYEEGYAAGERDAEDN